MLKGLGNNRVLEWLDLRETDIEEEELIKINKLLVRNRLGLEETEEENELQEEEIQVVEGEEKIEEEEEGDESQEKEEEDVKARLSQIEERKSSSKE